MVLARYGSILKADSIIFYGNMFLPWDIPQNLFCEATRNFNFGKNDIGTCTCIMSSKTLNLMGYKCGFSIK